MMDKCWSGFSVFIEIPLKCLLKSYLPNINNTFSTPNVSIQPGRLLNKIMHSSFMGYSTWELVNGTNFKPLFDLHLNTIQCI